MHTYDEEMLMICDDCGHVHNEKPFGFCKCGCTYPGWHWGWEEENE